MTGGEEPVGGEAPPDDGEERRPERAWYPK